MGNSLEFGKMKIGRKTLQDAALDLEALSKPIELIMTKPKF